MSELSARRMETRILLCHACISTSQWAFSVMRSWNTSYQLLLERLVHAHRYKRLAFIVTPTMLILMLLIFWQLGVLITKFELVHFTCHEASQFCELLQFAKHSAHPRTSSVQKYVDTRSWRRETIHVFSHCPGFPELSQFINAKYVNPDIRRKCSTTANIGHMRVCNNRLSVIVQNVIVRYLILCTSAQQGYFRYVTDIKDLTG